MYFDRAISKGFCLPHSWGSQANAVTSDGRTIAGADTAAAVLWIDGVRHVIAASGFRAATTALSSDGSMAVGYMSMTIDTSDAFIWSNGGLSILPPLGPGLNATAQAMSADGSVIVGYSGAGYQGWLVRWLKDPATGAYAIERIAPDDLMTYFYPGYSSSAVSPDGSIVGGSVSVSRPDGGDTPEAVIWTQRTGLQQVDALALDLPSGLILEDVRGIAGDNRTLVGNGQFIDEYGGNQGFFGWLLTLACPSDFDESGFVDTDDFDAFVHAFEAGTEDADVDGSGFVNLDDFAAFVLAYESGC